MRPCPECNTDNPEGSRFCGECGTSFTEDATGGTSAMSTLREGPAAIIVGSGEGADHRVDDATVSARHVRVSVLSPGRFLVEDLGSTNGTWVRGQRIDRTEVDDHEVLQLGLRPVEMGSILRTLGAVSPELDLTSTHSITIPEDSDLLLGRDPECDVVIDAAEVSWHHARISGSDGRWIIRDLGSRNGTWVNGSRVRTGALHPGDRLSLGSLRVELEHGVLRAPRRYEGEVRLDAEGLVRVVGAGLRILDEVSLSLYPGELIALMGPSGAGKTTLLELLTGQRRPTEGRVLFNGRDLHDHVRSLRDRIGYVPQEDVMHRDLTVFSVLYHAARMRLPGDLPRRAVVEHVDRLITRMGLAHVRDGLVGGEARRGISGGQRKRVNIALELITEPPLLFLDEPTSGLDATSTLEVLQVLRNLADSGRTIVMTIHQPRIEAWKLLDSLVLLAKGGKLAWFGAAHPDAVQHFVAHSALPFPQGGNPADYVIDVLDPPDPDLRREPDAWKADYLASEARERFVVQRRASDADVTLAPREDGKVPRAGMVLQYTNLLSRYLRRKGRDKTSLAIQLAQAPIVAILLGWLFFDSELPDPWLAGPSSGVYPTLFLLAASAFWFGCSNVARELVSERAVFRRERMAGLGTAPYLASIFTVQLALAAVQVSIMTMLAWVLVGLEPLSLVPATALLLITAAAGIGLGLLVSSLAPTEVTAIAVIPLLLLPQLMLAGFLKIYEEMDLLQAALTWLVPMRWSFEGLTWLELTVADYDLTIEDVFGFPMFDELSGVHGVLDAGILLGFSAGFLFLTWLRLATTRTAA